MRGRSAVLVLCVFFASASSGAMAAPARGPAGPAAAVLMDVRTGRVLYARAMQQKMAPASTTKVMTALLAIERLPPDAMVPISREAGAMHRGAVIGIRPGERWRVDDLLHAAMLRSANDAAVALAEAVAGSVPRFAALMNARAARLGARSTHFVNPHGLDAPDHYSTAHDLALIARAALHNHRFAVLVRTPVWTLDRPDRGREELANRNQLLTRYAGADGVKTGLTASAGYTFVGSATRDGWQLLAVVLKSHDMYADAARLLDYGFATFALVRVVGRGERVAATTVGQARRRVIAVPPQDVHAVLRRGAPVSRRVVWRGDLRLPIEAGARVAEVQVLEGAQIVARSPLVAAQRVGR
jgi:D-alanyl-D-alanine carboxypeptidase (penicillin-binding protein 5/6)